MSRALMTFFVLCVCLLAACEQSLVDSEEPVLLPATAKILGETRWGGITEDGEWKIPPTWEYLTPFSSGVAIGKRFDGGRDLVHADGTITSTTGYRWIAPFDGPIAAVKSSTGWGLIDRNAQVLLRPDHKRVKTFSAGAVVEVDDGVGFVDTSGEWTTPPVYDDAEVFPNGFIRVRVAGTTLWLDRSGQPISVQGVLQ